MAEETNLSHFSIVCVAYTCDEQIAFYTLKRYVCSDSGRKLTEWMIAVNG